MLTGKHPWPDAENPWSAIYAIANSSAGPPRPAGIGKAAASFIDACLRWGWRRCRCWTALAVAGAVQRCTSLLAPAAHTHCCIK